MTQSELHTLVHGSSILASGGGGLFTEARDLLDTVDPDPIELVEPKDMEGTAMTCYGVGTAGATVDDEIGAVQDLTAAAMHQWSPDAIVPAEMGPLAVMDAIIAADSLDLPLLDCDMADGRCVPTMQLNPLQSVIETDTVLVGGSSPDIEHGTLTELESLIRTKERDLVFVAGHHQPIPVLDTQLMSGTVHRAVSFHEHNLVNEVFNHIVTGMVTEVALSKEDGFLTGHITVENDAAPYTIAVKNEFMHVIHEDEVIVSVPDHLCIIDADTGYGPSSSEIAKGQTISLCYEPASGYWADAGKDAYQSLL